MTPQRTTGAVADSATVRERLVEALNLDLIGPGMVTPSRPSGCPAGCARRPGI